MMATLNSMICETLVVLLHLSRITCSLVIDTTGQRGVYVTDFCPKMEFCPEGAHVMCMYYNPKSVMGPRCANPRNLTMTPELANNLLDVSNEIRSKLAMGKEKGKNGEFLPRAYGMFRLKWDTELATFAQVLANQCVLRHDLCRATKRFPNPGQTAGLVRFSIPDWFPISKSGNFDTSGLSASKLLYATNMVLKSWYGQKNSVTPGMVTSHPDWSLNPAAMHGRLYLEMIYGSATHMGCGISAFTEYAFHDNKAALNYNSVLVICNYSARPTRGTATYNTVPPVDTALTHCVNVEHCSAAAYSKCGCPTGTHEDDDCLCQVVSKQDAHQMMNLEDATRVCPAGEVCDPTVVLLPIFTVEDAPPEKLFTGDSYAISSLRKPIKDVGIFHREGNNLLKEQGHDSMAEIIVNKPQVKYDSEAKSAQKQLRAQDKHRPTSRQLKGVKNRYFGKNAIELKTDKRALNLVRKNSIFNKAPKFELPTTQIRPSKPVVVPRKDFSNAKKLVSNYLLGKKNTFEIEHTTETFLNTAEQRILNQDVLFQQVLSRKNDYAKTMNITEKNKNKLITLLDTLEKEVNNVQLHDKDKRLFDAKIRKIYGKMVGNHFSSSDVKIIQNINNSLHKSLQDPKEELIFEKYGMKMERPDNSDLQNNKNKRYNDFRNSSHSHNDIDKYDDITALYKKRFNLRGLKHNDLSYEQLRNRYQNYGNYHTVVDRKSHNNNDFGKDTLSDIENKYRSRKEMSFNHRNNDFEYLNSTNGHRNSDLRAVPYDIDQRIRNNNYYLSNEDPLSVERRRFYQEKLDNIETRLENRRSWNKRPKNKPRQMRPVLRTSEMEYRRGNARYAHGYR